MKSIKVQYFIVLILFFTVNLISVFTQNRINVNGGKGWDGVQYCAMADSISHGTHIIGEAPLVHRIGTPFIASLLNKNNSLEGFFHANLIANFFSCLLLFSFLKGYIKNLYIIFSLIILYLFHWLCSTRFIYFEPALTDSWGLVFFLIGLVLIEMLRRKKSFIGILLLSVCVFIGVLFREYILIIAISFLFMNNPLGSKSLLFIDFKEIFGRNLGIAVPFIAGVAGIIITHLVTSSTNTDYSFIHTAISQLFDKSFIQYFYAWFVAVGPILALLLFFYKKIFLFLFKNQHLLILLISAFCLSFIGGSNTGRFILWYIPIILLIEGYIIQNHLFLLKKISFILPLIVLQTFSNKFFLPIPQPPQTSEELGFPLMDIIESGDFLNIVPQLGNMKLEFGSFLKYCIAICYLLIILRYYSKKTSTKIS